MKVFCSIGLALSLIILSAPASAIPVTVNPGNYAGVWDVDFNGVFFAGPQTVDLSEGYHWVRPGTIGRIGIHVSAAGAVTPSDTRYVVSILGGQNSATFLTRPVTVNVGAYSGEWEISRVRPAAPGSAVVHLIPNDEPIGMEYLFSAGIASSHFVVQLRGDGTPTSLNTDAMTASGSTLQWGNTTLSVVNRNGPNGLFWSVRQVATGTANAAVVHVPGLEYALQTNGDSKNYVVSSPCAATPPTLEMAGVTFDLVCGDVTHAGPFLYPNLWMGDLAFDGSHLYLTTMNGSRLIHKIDPTTGQVVAVITQNPYVTNDPRGATSDEAGKLFVGTLTPNVCELQTNGTLVGCFALPDPVPEPHNPGFRSGAMAFDGTHFYIGDIDTDAILVTNRAGAVQRYFQTGRRPDGMAFDPLTGRLWLADIFVANKLTEMTTTGAVVRECEAPYTPGAYGLGGVAIIGNKFYVASPIKPASPGDGTQIHVLDRSSLVCVSRNLAPTADAGPGQSIHAGSMVTLNGANSFDDNTPTAALRYAWTFTSRPAGSSAPLTNAATATPNFVADKAGTYTAQLIVTDDAGAPSAPAQVVVSSLNQAPTANAGADQVVVIGRPVNLVGTGSRDPDGDALTYAWAIASAPAGSTAAISPATSPTPSLTPNVTGTYVLTLNVADAFGPGVADSASITVDTASDYVASKVTCAADIVRSLAPNQVTNKGNQKSFLKLLGNALSAKQGDHEHSDDDDDDRRESGESDSRFNARTAIKKLTKAIERTDGCTSRGTPDTKGDGRDWITDCTAQVPVHACLSEAVQALTAP